MFIFEIASQKTVPMFVKIVTACLQPNLIYITQSGTYSVADMQQYVM